MTSSKGPILTAPKIPNGGRRWVFYNSEAQSLKQALAHEQLRQTGIAVLPIPVVCM